MCSSERSKLNWSNQEDERIKKEKKNDKDVASNNVAINSSITITESFKYIFEANMKWNGYFWVKNNISIRRWGNKSNTNVVFWE